ncbi:hypothetical protein ER308_07320 [Egibacter rhizosphaerae]|uniref:Uncharacterized protein n=1 Tax=Egibacter rhizosphaerae TaxID=1670831 RepID=A0A411YDT3_9ACTN|nr:hypothetical protein [Egibacter rhizosphaerae]QBI19375.1 hypothetical protein ER308_07320 [Egibacter rhizosphaerae]
MPRRQRLFDMNPQTMPGPGDPETWPPGARDEYDPIEHEDLYTDPDDPDEAPTWLGYAKDW